MATAPRPQAVVICGPSGVGKGTLISRLLADQPQDFGFSVSVTTRGPRPGELDGTHYHFLSLEEAEAQIEQGAFVEYARVHGTLYGTPRSSVDAVTATGAVCILDIDVQGAEQVKRSGLLAKYIFIAPPSFEALEARLRGRATETEDKILKRLAGARNEMLKKDEPGFFDVVIVNDDLNTAYQNLREAIADAVPLALSEPMMKRGLSELAPTNDGVGMAFITLDVAHGAISNFSTLRKLPQLRNVLLPHNRLESLAPLATLIHLCQLDVSHNRLSGPSVFAGLASTLVKIDASCNAISGLEGVSRLTSLRQLKLASNELDVERLGDSLLGLHFLNELDLSCNRFSGRIPLPLPPTLRELSVCGNRLIELHFTQPMEALLGLSASGNMMVSANGLDGCKALLHVDLSANHIKTSADVEPLKALSALGGLRLDANPLCEHPTYRVDVLHSLQQLQVLDLQPISPEDKVRALNAFGAADEEMLQIRLRHFPAEAGVVS